MDKHLQSDRIDQLPTTAQKPTSIDLAAINNLFKQQQQQSKNSLMKTLIPVGLFVLLSLPFVDNMIKANVTESEMLGLFAKAVVFLVIYSILNFLT